MPKKLIKKYMPSPESIKEHKHLAFLGEKLHDPNLWHLNRRSVAAAFAVGLFVAWIPTPGQMIISAITALFFRANLPISVALVWITNPLTMPPMFYFAYRFGLWTLNLPPPSADFEFSLESVTSGLTDIGGPFLLGCLILGIASSVIGYFSIRLFWRWHVVKQWRARSER
ncbi:ATP-binding protein [Methyloprofundus sedimenti]|uniref:ATP-binding protein n=1 Tax=Methyloprofundus sedimenti TaxID=1420851 RepID=A0A1V8M9Z0_9GAMM|nr:DUF2062 domain-containing protein [Methyloprofundus sedimenti]OQK18379.1 ATP-binding protein [Methyloprofundus sedimenti]